MSAFSDDELTYLRGERRLARVATVGADGTPHVVPVGWSQDPELDAIEVVATSSTGRRSLATCSETDGRQS